MPFKGQLCKKITCGRPSIFFSYENHVLKIFQLTIFFTPHCIMQLGVKFRNQTNLRSRSKRQKVLGVNLGPTWVLLMGKTVGKKSGATVPFVHYHFGGSMKLNTRILFFAHMVYL
jgi:hypothetical protein